ncbi:MAG: flagellar filament capping protein FliD [Rickettsiaceae bacterium]
MPTKISSLLDTEYIFDVQKKPIDKKIVEIKDRLDLVNKGVVEYEQLKSKMHEMQTIAKDLGLNNIAASTNNIFKQQQPIVATSDTGNGSDYMLVTTDTTLNASDASVEIKQLASAAYISGKSVADNFTAQADYAIDITITESDASFAQYNIAINENSTLTQIRDKINTILVDDNAQAIILNSSSDNTQRLLIRSKTLGSRTIDITEVSDATLFAAGPVSNTGQNSIVSVYGDDFTNPTNSVEIIPGMKFELYKTNTTGNTQNITMSQNVTPVLEVLQKFINVINEYFKFSSTHQEQQNAEWSENAILGQISSKYIRSIDSKILSIYSTITGSTISHLSQIGIELNNTNNNHELRFVDDGSALTSAVVDNTTELAKLFQSQITITDDPGNVADSNLIFFQSTKLLPLEVLNTDILIKCNSILGTAQFSLDDGTTWLSAQYDNGYISFTETALSGINLHFTKGSAIDEQTFTFKYTQGLSDILNAASMEIIGDFPNKGIIDHAQENLSNVNDSLKKDLAAQEEKLSKLDQDMSSLNYAMAIGQMQIDMYKEIFRSSSKD